MGPPFLAGRKKAFGFSCEKIGPPGRTLSSSDAFHDFFPIQPSELSERDYVRKGTLDLAGLSADNPSMLNRPGSN